MVSLEGPLESGVQDARERLAQLPLTCPTQPRGHAATAAARRGRRLPFSVTALTSSGWKSGCAKHLAR